MLTVHTILHPTDFSERSQDALRLACALARDYGARLIVLHVAEAATVATAEGVVLPPDPEEARRAGGPRRRTKFQSPTGSVRGFCRFTRPGKNRRRSEHRARRGLSPDARARIPVYHSRRGDAAVGRSRV